MKSNLRTAFLAELLACALGMSITDGNFASGISVSDPFWELVNSSPNPNLGIFSYTQGVRYGAGLLLRALGLVTPYLSMDP